MLRIWLLEMTSKYPVYNKIRQILVWAHQRIDTERLVWFKFQTSNRNMSTTAYYCWCRRMPILQVGSPILIAQLFGRPSRATSFNSSGLIQASEIKLTSGFADKNILKLVIDIARASDFQRSFRVRLRFLSTPLRSSLAGLCLYEKDLYQAVQKNHSIQRSGPSKGADNLNHDQNDTGKDSDLQPLPHQSTTRGFIHTWSDDGDELHVDRLEGTTTPQIDETVPNASSYHVGGPGWLVTFLAIVFFSMACHILGFCIL